VYGDTKSAIVQGVKDRGGVAAVGVGDKFTSSDAFIHLCRVKGHVNNKAADQGEVGLHTVKNRLATDPRYMIK
jgi:hypothetical protein